MHLGGKGLEYPAFWNWEIGNYFGADSHPKNDLDDGMPLSWIFDEFRNSQSQPQSPISQYPLLTLLRYETYRMSP